MSMKTILVPMEPQEGMTSVLETALLLARRCGSYIEGFPLRFGISEFVAVDPAGSIPLESYRQESLEEAAQARRLFEAFMQERNIPQSNGPTGGLSFGWLDDAPEGEGFVGSYGRVFDVTVLSRPDANTIGLHNRAIEFGLFESGRPILLSPPSPPKQIATNIMIAWNCSTEQARATAFAMPLLHQAERVTVLTVAGGSGVPGPSAEQLLKHLQLQRHRRKADDRGARRTQHRRSDSGRGKIGRLRPAGQGRLHPEPVAADDIRRGHQPHSGERRIAGSDGALSAPVAP